MPGFDLPTTHQGIEFARRHGLKTTAGIHPHVANSVDGGVWDAVRELATREEVAETISVSMYMGGGPAFMYGARALEAFDQFSG